MDLIHELLNVLLPPSLLLLFLLSLPFLLVYKFLSFLKVSFSPENVSGKVVLITGASSGIGEYVAYECAKRKARLALVARREDRLLKVADEARRMGSPEVIVICADVSKVEDCRRFVAETVSHFGQLDHLVSNAGVVHTALFEEIPIDELSSSSWITASKGAQISFFETLRVELGSDIGITIVAPGLVHSEITGGQFLSKLHVKNVVPVQSTEGCAKEIVNGVCRGDEYVIVPRWYGALFWVKVILPQVVQWCAHFLVK